jgi:DNA modification methylase
MSKRLILPRPSERVEEIATASLKPAPRNPRKHPQAQIEKIARSMQQFGVLLPILIDGDNEVIAGHGRLEAAKSLGLETVPVLRITHLSPAEQRAYVIADNRLAELSEFDNDLLTAELAELVIEAPDLDVTALGFEVGEVDRMLLGDEPPCDDDPADHLPDDLQDGQVVCRPGDLWLLGEHRLLIGDARVSDNYRKLLGGKLADLGFTDSPYNVPIQGHARGKGQHQHGDFAVASGELSKPEFIKFLETAFNLMATSSRPGALHYTWMDWRHLHEALTAGHKVYASLINVCVWDKMTGGMGSLYRSQHELALVWRTRGAAHTNNVALGKYGRNRSNVWRHPGANSFGKHRLNMLALHPTVKPVALVAGAILDSTKRGDLVLDPFLGSGTTIIAAHKTGRRAAGLELDPTYGDVIIRRFERYTGSSAVHAQSGLSFAEEAEARGIQSADSTENA